MSHFYIHQRHSSGDWIVDEEGADFPTLAEAHAEAIASARDLAIDIIRSGKILDLEMRLEIADETGVALESVTMREALQTPPSFSHA